MNLALVISDNSKIEKSISIYLKGSFIFTTLSKEQSLEGALSRPLDLLFLDLPLEGKEPFSLLKKIQDLKPDLPVIALLPKATSASVAEALKMKVYDILFKPLEKERLKTCVQHALEKNSLIKEKRFLEEKILRLSEKKSVNKIPEPKNFFFLEALRKFSRATLNLFDKNRLMTSLVESLAETFGLSQVALFLEKEGTYRMEASVGWGSCESKNISFSASEGLGPWLERERQILQEETLNEIILSRVGVQLQKEMELARAKVCVPLLAKGRLLGFLALGNKINGKRFTEEDLDFFSFLTNYLGLVIDNSLLYHKVFLKKKEQEMILNHLGAGVVAVDNAGQIITFNQSASEILKLSPEKMLGAKSQKLGSQLADFIWRALKKNELFQNNRIIYTPTKSPLQVTTSLIKNEEGKVAGAVLIFSDLTPLEKLEKKVNYLERLNFWYKLASSMAHEIKNPLVAIKTFVQLFPEKYQDVEFREKFFKVVSGEVKRLEDIIYNLFKFAKPGEIHYQKVSLSKILNASLQEFSEEFGNKIEVVKDYPSPLMAEIDQEKIKEVFHSLLKNAAQAMKNGGKLTVKAKEVNKDGRSFIKINFEDNGCGIPPENLSEIFSPFYTTQAKGMGLGLPIARRIIEEHKGKIDVTSNLKKGTIFHLLIPTERIKNEEDFSS